MKITVIGSGRWGSFIAWYLSRKQFDITVCGRADSAHFAELVKTRKNEFVTFDYSVKFSTDFISSISEAEVVIISISSQALRGFLKGLGGEVFKGKKVVLCMKGIEENTGKRLTEVAVECGIDSNSVAIWVGPGHIQEFLALHPNCMLIDSHDPALTKELADAFRSDIIRFYYGDDLIGSEIGAAAKNVMGIAAGMLDGAGYTSLKGGLMARGTREIARLIKAAGGNELSAYGLCHLGDYEATLFSPWSHNRRFGEMYIKGEQFQKLAEGVMTSKALCILGDRLGVDLPITKAVYRILFEHADPMTELNALFMRSIKKEF